jgi:hypothetical protein
MTDDSSGTTVKRLADLRRRGAELDCRLEAGEVTRAD